MTHGPSENEIATSAREWRKFLGYGADEQLDMFDFITRLQQSTELTVRQVDAHYLPGTYAQTSFESKIIWVREEVVIRLKAGDPRAHFTLAEEVGHFILRHPGVRNRTIGSDTKALNRKDVARQEREARMFAAALLAPLPGALSCDSPSEIQNKYGLSKAAAEIRFEEVKKTIRRQERVLRAIPSSAHSFLKDAEAAGYRIKHADLRIVETSDANARKNLAVEANLRGYESEPCPECGNLTVYRRGSDLTCGTCGRPCGCQ